MLGVSSSDALSLTIRRKLVKLCARTLSIVSLSHPARLNVGIPTVIFATLIVSRLVSSLGWSPANPPPLRPPRLGPRHGRIEPSEPERTGLTRRPCRPNAAAPD